MNNKILNLGKRFFFYRAPSDTPPGSDFLSTPSLCEEDVETLKHDIKPPGSWRFSFIYFLNCHDEAIPKVQQKKLHEIQVYYNVGQDSGGQGSV